MNEPVASDRSHLHFGAGETEARIELPPGRHTLAAAAGRQGPHPARPAHLFEENHRHGQVSPAMRKQLAAAIAPSPLALTAAVLAGAMAATPAATPAPPGAYLYIGWPNDGQVVSSGKPIRVWFGLRNMGVAPKGVKFPHTGHHHLLIDADAPGPGVESRTTASTCTSAPARPKPRSNSRPAGTRCSW
jgi:hypothetical protein